MKIEEWANALSEPPSKARTTKAKAFAKADEETRRTVALALVDMAVAAGPCEPLDPVKRSYAPKDARVDYGLEFAFPILFPPPPADPLLSGDQAPFSLTARLAEELTPLQRDVMVKLSRFEVLGPFFIHRLPQSARVRRRWLGLEPPGALEKRVRVELRGATHELPVWRVACFTAQCWSAVY